MLLSDPNCINLDIISHFTSYFIPQPPPSAHAHTHTHTQAATDWFHSGIVFISHLMFICSGSVVTARVRCLLRWPTSPFTVKPQPHWGAAPQSVLAVAGPLDGISKRVKCLAPGRFGGSCRGRGERGPFTFRGARFLQLAEDPWLESVHW